MSRRARPAAKAAPPPGERPFAALRGLLAKERSAPSPAPTESAQPLANPRTEAANTAASETARRAQDAADGALFRQAIGPTTALRDSGRAEIERPRPPPLPRPRAAEQDIDDPPTQPHLPADPLRAAYEGVTPLRATDRVEPETRHRHAAQAGSSGHDNPLRLEDLLMLPAEDGQEWEDGRLFQQVVGATRPLRSTNRIELQAPSPLPHPIKREADERAALDESLLTPPNFEDRLEMGDEAAFLRPGLPRRVLTDLRRGRWVLQAQIDLHGFNRDEARAALAAFLRDSLQQGHRCIRVIHGKGLGSPGRISILKQLSRGWLAQREEILAFCQAGPREGGEGALLVLMRAQNAAPD